MHTLEELDVYNLSQSFSDKIWFPVLEWHKFAQFGVGKQITNSADSISSNIAEGYGRYLIKENINFCFYSRGNGYIKILKENLKKQNTSPLITNKPINQ